ncbi:metal ABC transporter permease [Schaalia suimastitidis]|uniref:metal ABC transporter permease n=1 Tax=Schaalia suimastitidis TaxID=121163 RepID=UPI000418458E|nr:metal ABC transporter permease [Schaalia suimastitidis]
MDLIDIFITPFSYGFMSRALISALAASGVCALLSCWLVLVGWSLMGDAVSHAVLPGVVLAYIAGVPFAFGAILFGAGAVVLIGIVQEKTRLRQDAAIGIVFTTFFALGLVLVSITPSHIDLGHIVFGNLLGVSTVDMLQVVVLAVLVAIVLVVTRHDLTLVTFDPAHAYVIGLSPQILNGILLGALAVTTVVALQVVGVILVVALLILPGAIARLLTQRITTMLLIAPTTSMVCTVGGLLVSYHADIASGATVVLFHGAAFLAAWLLSPQVGVPVLARRHRQRRAGRTTWN